MRKNIKIIAWFLCMILLVSVLWSCVENDGGDGNFVHDPYVEPEQNETEGSDSGVSNKGVKYVILYELDGGENDSRNPRRFTSDTAPFELKYPTKKGYDFIGWTWEGNTTPVLDVIVDTSMGHDVTYKANWSPKKYELTLDAAGGECETYQITVEYGEALVIPTPTRESYLFLGWYFENLKYEFERWQLLEDVTLTAKWIESEVYAGKDLALYTEITDDGEEAVTVPCGTKLERTGIEGNWSKVLYDGEEYYVLDAWLILDRSVFEFTEYEKSVDVVVKNTSRWYFSPVVGPDSSNCLVIRSSNLDKKYDLKKIAEGDGWVKVSFKGTITIGEEIYDYSKEPAIFYIQNEYFKNGALDDITYDQEHWTPIA